MEFKDNYVIAKSNSLISDVKYKTTLLEFKFLAVMTSLVQPEDKNFKYYKVKTKDLIHYLGLEKNARAYNDLYNAIKSLQKKTITVYEEDGWTDISWIASARYRQKQGIIEFEFSERLKPYLLQLKDNFTRFEVIYIKNLTSIHSARIYELIKQWSFMNREVLIGVDELKEVLGLESKYKLYGDFKRNVLEVAKSEIPEKTDLTFDYREEKTGRRVTKIVFHSIKKVERELSDTPLEGVAESLEELVAIDQEMIDELLKVGVLQGQAEELLAKGFTVIEDKSGDIEKSKKIQQEVQKKFVSMNDYLRSKVGLLKAQHQQKPKRNPTGFLLDAIRYNYEDRKNEIDAPIKPKLEERKKIQGRLLQINELLEKEQLEADLQELQAINSLMDSNASLLQEVADASGAKRHFLYDPTKSLNENYSRPTVKAIINAEIKKKYPDKFVFDTTIDSAKIFKLLQEKEYLESQLEVLKK